MLLPLLEAAARSSTSRLKLGSGWRSLAFADAAGISGRLAERSFISRLAAAPGSGSAPAIRAPVPRSPPDDSRAPPRAASGGGKRTESRGLAVRSVNSARPSLARGPEKLGCIHHSTVATTAMPVAANAPIQTAGPGRRRTDTRGASGALSRRNSAFEPCIGPGSGTTGAAPRRRFSSCTRFKASRMTLIGFPSSRWRRRQRLPRRGRAPTPSASRRSRVPRPDRRIHLR